MRNERILRDMMDTPVGECVSCGVAARAGNIPIVGDITCEECGGYVIHLPAWLENFRTDVAAVTRRRRSV